MNGRTDNHASYFSMVDKAFRARMHYKHAVIAKVFLLHVDTFVKCQQPLPKNLSIKKTEQRAGYGAK